MPDTKIENQDPLKKIRDFTKTAEYTEYHSQEKVALMLAARIKQIRESKHWTQQDLANKMKVTQSVVARLEAGKKGISLKTITRFIEAIDGKLEIIY
jgi:ribosome-binding protein aMBF1 (putative translation factor)